MAKGCCVQFVAGVALALALLPAQALQVQDDKGAVLTLPRPAERIVSLLPALTEIVCALDQCERLVGVDEHSNFPAPVRRLPVVGSGLEPGIEAVVALKPDLVLLAGSSRAIKRLQSLGIPVLALEPRTHADLQRVLKTLGVVLGLPEARAQALWQRITASLAASAKALPEAARRKRVYIEVGRGPYAASESSFMGETLTRLGARNIVPGSLGPFPLLNPEFVVRADPELIIVSAGGAGGEAGEGGAEGLQLYPGWAGIAAVRGKHVCVFKGEQADALARPGPRLAEAAALMARCLEANSK